MPLEKRNSFSIPEGTPPPAPVTTGSEKPLTNLENPQVNRLTILQQMLMGNASDSLLTRQNLFRTLIDPKRDIDAECGYPKTIDDHLYFDLYDRGDIAARVVDVLPTESWKKPPVITSNQAGKETEWEKVIKAINTDHNVFAKLEELDVRSGIGRFGILLLGVNDGKTLDQPIDGVPDKWDSKKLTGVTKRELLYLRVFDESAVKVKTWNRVPESPRFGKPEMYTISFTEEGTSISYSKDVHWTRVIHVADNRRNSEVMGRPRMQLVFNRLYDLKKLLGGCAEMFWKGGFPGYGIKIDPQLLKDGVPVTVDKSEVKAEMEQYFNQLQRYFLLEGLTVESLEPQVVDPTNHFKVFILAICIALGVPYRIFMGSEEAQLAGEQDSQAWRDRLTHRIIMHVEPYIVREFINRLMQIGILPVTEEYFVNWPDLFSLSDKDRAEIMAKMAEAMAKYVTNAVAESGLMAPMEFLTHVCEFTQDEAEDILTKAKEYVEANVPEDDDLEEEEEEDPPTPGTRNGGEAE